VSAAAVVLLDAVVETAAAAAAEAEAAGMVAMAGVNPVVVMSQHLAWWLMSHLVVTQRYVTSSQGLLSCWPRSHQHVVAVAAVATRECKGSPAALQQLLWQLHCHISFSQLPQQLHHSAELVPRALAVLMLAQVSAAQHCKALIQWV